MRPSSAREAVRSRALELDVRPRLRVGVILDASEQPAWVRRLIREVETSCVAKVEVVAIADRSATNQSTRHQPRANAPLLYRLYTKLDDRLFRSSSDAFQVASVDDLLTAVDLVELDGSRHGGTADPVPSALARIRDHRLDVLLDLTSHAASRSLPDGAVDLAAHGVWFLHHGESLSTFRAPPGFWEVMDGEVVTGSVLAVRRGNPPSEQVIFRSYAPTDNRSVRRSKNNYYWKTAGFISRKLRDLYERGPSTLTLSGATDPTTVAPHRRRFPSDLEVLGGLAHLGGSYLAGKLDRLRYADTWFIAYSTSGSSEPGRAPETGRLTYLVPPRDRYWADPFPVADGDDRYIFLEEFVRDRGQAHIAVVRVGADGRAEPPVKILERNYHLSYPLVFRWDGQYYMLPETRGNRTVEVYRADHFPDTWTLHRVLLHEINAVDATLEEIDGRWWLFANVAAEGAANLDELHLFYADHPFGPWQPHRFNPVKSDARSARPAGRLIRADGALIRPSQDCSGRYGRAVILNRIVRLDPDGYAEEEIGRIEPSQRVGVLGTHTVNLANGMVCLDGVLRAPRLRHGANATPNNSTFVATGTAAKLLSDAPNALSFSFAGVWRGRYSEVEDVGPRTVD